MTRDQTIIADFAHLQGMLQAIWDMSPKEPVGMSDALETAVEELDELRNDVCKALGIECGVEMKAQ